jgi:hypothetical protein
MYYGLWYADASITFQDNKGIDDYPSCAYIEDGSIWKTLGSVTFDNNRIQSTSSVDGGAVYLYYSTWEAWGDVLFTDNYVNTTSNAYGGGILAYQRVPYL